MRVVGISGSPRRGGNTDILLDKVLEGARSKGAITEKIFLNRLDYRPCQECGGCDRTGACILPDDMRSVYKKIEKADSVVVASPIFFTSLTAQLKMMIDRFQCRWIAKYVLGNEPQFKKNKKGIFLSAAASGKKEFFSRARKIVRAFFVTIDAEYAGELFCHGLEKKGAVKKKRMILARAFRLGKSLVS